MDSEETIPEEICEDIISHIYASFCIPHGLIQFKKQVHRLH